ncbi:DUF5819 family protein [Streptomyces tirandamycinicus]|uniref:DUF5819 family protein n=1 Tax=Streptomyces tirandamycinicus TaxID=2174846 RepID=UPI002271E9C0|nr:DUF5819 family protein [Streptomyces tirandamycinicus]MCY0979980.1 DUF5819 family protein [Streptomyces tirandamycinicus]
MDSYDGDGAARAEAAPPAAPGGIRDAHGPDGPAGPDGPSRPDGSRGPDARRATAGKDAAGEPGGTALAVHPYGPASASASASASAGAGAAEDAPHRQHPAGGIAALSLPYQIVAAVALGLVAVFACVHVAMVFLHVAPSNTVTKQHGKGVDEWVYPEFEQNWKLFAPNPLQQNIAVQARAELTGRDGTRRTSDWIDLSAEDGEAIRGNLLPSHVHQNELRRGWDFYVNSHTDDNKPNGLRGQLSERYVRRIVMTRLDRHDLGGRVERIQLRSATRSVKAPVWSREKIDTRPYYRVLPWWTVTSADLPLDVRNGAAGGAGDEEADR